MAVNLDRIINQNFRETETQYVTYFGELKHNSKFCLGNRIYFEALFKIM